MSTLFRDPVIQIYRNLQRWLLGVIGKKSGRLAVTVIGERRKLYSADFVNWFEAELLKQGSQ